jgi:hypothetical protein
MRPWSSRGCSTSMPTSSEQRSAPARPIRISARSHDAPHAARGQLDLAWPYPDRRHHWPCHAARTRRRRPFALGRYLSAAAPRRLPGLLGGPYGPVPARPEAGQTGRSARPARPGGECPPRSPRGRGARTTAGLRSTSSGTSPSFSPKPGKLLILLASASDCSHKGCFLIPRNVDHYRMS